VHCVAVVLVEQVLLPGNGEIHQRFGLDLRASPRAALLCRDLSFAEYGEMHAALTLTWSS